VSQFSSKKEAESELDAAGRGSLGDVVEQAGSSGGRAVETRVPDPELLETLRALVESDTRGDPERVLLWTSKSLRNLASDLHARGHRASKDVIGRLLKDKLGFSLQSARKTLEGRQHPDRDQQFQHINETVGAAISTGQPAISIDTKKKELVGEFENGGREWHPKSSPTRVNTHDFPSLAAGKAIPYGVYDIADDTGMVSVGIDHDTAQFSVAAIQAWWEQLGQPRYPQPSRLVITADCGGSNATAPAYGRPSCRSSLTTPALRSSSATSRPGPASGTKSSIVYSASSPATGAASH
jgi:hypothetical protein